MAQQAHPPAPSRLPRRGWFGWRGLWRAWGGLRPFFRHWLCNIAIGVLIELILHGLEPLHLRLLLQVENFALDSMMALHAVIARAPQNQREPPYQIFVNVDDATWRGKDWGGGEPYRAPRDALFKLIKTAIENGATQVVLDILVEGERAARPQEQQEDAKFAEDLRSLLNKEDASFAKHLRSLLSRFGPNQQLVLVRSVRPPLPQVELDKDGMLRRMLYPALGELRESPSVDEVVSDSHGKIVVAAPYFMDSPDRMLRDWRLLKVVCRRIKDGPSGVLRVVPSVQLMVAAKYFGVPADKMPAQEAGNNCAPFPAQELADQPQPPLSSSNFDKRQKEVNEQSVKASDSYWKALRSAVLDAKRVDIGEAVFDKNGLGNRVVFRSGPNLEPDKHFVVVPARLLLLPGSDIDKRVASMFDGRVVVIGQSYIEAGDRHYTPMGQLPGAVVLQNAIDSMVRYPLIKPLNDGAEHIIDLLVIIVIGGVFAWSNSARASLISTAVLVPTLAFVSFHIFTYGMWLDFALPVVGILIHREVKNFEERARLRKLERQRGGDPQH